MVGMTMLIEYEGIEYVVDADFEGETVDIRICRADGEYCVDNDDLRQYAIGAVSYALVENVEPEIIH